MAKETQKKSDESNSFGELSAECFSPLEQQILAIISFNASLTANEISEKIGVEVHRVRYCLKRMFDQHLLSFEPFVNLFRLGFSVYTVFFSTKDHSQKNFELVKNVCMNNPRVCWLVHIGGIHEYGVSISARSSKSMLKIWEALQRKLHIAAFSLPSEIVEVLSLTHYSPVTSAEKSSSLHHEVKAQDIGGSTTIDEDDHNILVSLSAQSKLNFQQIATSVSLSAPTVANRIRRLQEEKVLGAFCYTATLRDRGYFDFVLLLKVHSISESTVAAIHDIPRRCPLVSFIIQMQGAWDFEVGIQIRTKEQLAKINSIILNVMGAGLKDIRLVPIFSYIKTTKYPFLSYKDYLADSTSN